MFKSKILFNTRIGKIFVVHALSVIWFSGHFIMVSFFLNFILFSGDGVGVVLSNSSGSKGTPMVDDILTLNGQNPRVF